MKYCFFITFIIALLNTSTAQMPDWEVRNFPAHHFKAFLPCSPVLDTLANDSILQAVEWACKIVVPEVYGEESVTYRVELSTLKNENLKDKNVAFRAFRKWNIMAADEGPKYIMNGCEGYDYSKKSTGQRFQKHAAGRIYFNNNISYHLSQSAPSRGMITPNSTFFDSFTLDSTIWNNAFDTNYHCRVQLPWPVTVEKTWSFQKEYEEKFGAYKGFKLTRDVYHFTGVPGMVSATLKITVHSNFKATGEDLRNELFAWHLKTDINAKYKPSRTIPVTVHGYPGIKYIYKDKNSKVTVLYVLANHCLYSLLVEDVNFGVPGYCESILESLEPLPPAPDRNINWWYQRRDF